MELIVVTDTTETKDTGTEEEELTLAEEFILLEKEFDAFMIRKKRLLKRLGLVEARPPRKDSTLIAPEKKDVSALVQECLVRYNKSEGKYLIGDSDKIGATWLPDQHIHYKLDKRIVVRIGKVSRKKKCEDGEKEGKERIGAICCDETRLVETERSEQEKNEDPLSHDEVRELKEILIGLLEEAIKCQKGQIDIEFAEHE
jgi:hypothetical protein